MKKIVALIIPCFFAAILLFATSCKKSVPDQVKYIRKTRCLFLTLTGKACLIRPPREILTGILFKSANVTSDTEFAFVKGKIDEFMKSGIDESANVFYLLKPVGLSSTGQSTSRGCGGCNERCRHV